MNRNEISELVDAFIERIPDNLSKEEQRNALISTFEQAYNLGFEDGSDSEHEKVMDYLRGDD